MLQIGRSLVRFQMVSLEFFIHIILRSYYGPGVDSASNKNEYQEDFLGVKAAGAYGLQPYQLPVPLSWNLGTLTSWNPLGHSRPVTGLLYLYSIRCLDRTSGFQEVETSRISINSAHEGGKIVSPKHRLPLPPRRYPWYSFLLESESTPGP